MRLADGPTESASIRIDADVDTVWRLVTDISLPARFSEEFVGGDWLDGATGPALGAQFRGTNERGDLRWSVICTVTEYEPGHRFGWSVGDTDDPLARWRFTITPHDGGVELEEWCWMGTASSGLSAAIERRPEREAQIVEYRMNRHRDAMTATITGIKELAEA